MTDNTWIMIGTLGTAVATFLLAVFAFYAWQAAKSTAQAAKDTLDHAREDSHQRTRPYVAATVVPSIAGVAKYDIVLMNYGNSSARGVRIRCVNAPSSPDDVATKILRWLSITHTLHPNMRLRNYWRLELDEGSTWKDGTREPVGMPAP